VAAAAGVAGVEARSESKTGNKAWLRSAPPAPDARGDRAWRDHLDTAV
tara:strand:- start:623 stop:766 length:144 start_codon:yes stop_codon:yes gene_type:complete